MLDSKTVVQKFYQGLSSQQASDLLIQFGRNQIQKEKTRPVWFLFVEQFKSPLVLILIFACIISWLLGENLEAAAIGIIVLLNAAIGFFQEYRAENAIAALQEMTSPRAKVIRDGRQTVISAHDLVPGDILLLEAGDVIGADAEILAAARLQVNEAAITGESLPVLKEVGRKESNQNFAERTSSVFMGTSVTTGTATTRVTATGMPTELGHIAHLISTAQTETTPLQRQLAIVGRSLLIICILVVVLIAILSFARGMSWIEVMIFSLSLAVAAVPEGLPAIVTVALALGVQRMAGRNALVRKLPSVETLGSVSVICTDKTGTLTTGNMRVRELWGEDHDALLYAATACCDAELADDADSGMGDPTEIAILISAAERGLHKENLEDQNPRVSVEPFDPDRKRMSIYRSDGVNYVKGAIEALAPLSSDDPQKIERTLKAASDMSSRGLRVIAVGVAHQAQENDISLVGLIAIADPPRTEAMQAIEEAKKAGIIPIMITGDHPQTAIAIAKELKLVAEQDDIDTRVYARATPEDKLNLIRHWKAQGAVVAMTGDGVNDAPALREAHIGIAMGKTGTEVTRQAADLILADDNFATIVAAVREGRNLFQNIRKAVIYLLIGNLGEILLVAGAILLGLPLPLLAAHLLWINLVTDAFPALTLIADPVSPGVMERPPRKVSEPIIGKPEWIQIVGTGLLEAVISLTLFWYWLHEHDEIYSRSLIFSTLVFSQLFRSFGARSRTRTFWQVGAFSNLWLLAIVAGTAALQLSLYYIPLAQDVFGLQPLVMTDFFIIIPLALIPITLIEMKKIIKSLSR